MSASDKNLLNRCIITSFLGSLLGYLLVKFGNLDLAPIPFVLCIPFIGLLFSIALTPLLFPKWWHNNYPCYALFLASLVAAIYVSGISSGTSKLLHALHEYFSFLALVGGLYIVSSCIKLEISNKTTASYNTALLALGAVLANLLGTTGASMLLIRPYIKMNKNRIQPWHILFFILIVSNCGGALTPIGDPPLYLGYLKGIPFFWTTINLRPSWLLVNGCLLLIYYIFEKYYNLKHGVEEPSEKKFNLEGKLGIICLLLMILAVFIDPLLSSTSFKGFPATATIQSVIAISCYLYSSKEIKTFNSFSFEPFKEVAFIFAGIFATMIPALEYLAYNASYLNLSSAHAYYLGTGVLSSILDNAPTYLNFLQVAVGNDEIDARSLKTLIEDPYGNHILMAISTGAVFFGALTYIGNGPNFMVKSISDASGIKTYSFFGYAFRAVLILGPILAFHAWLLF